MGSQQNELEGHNRHRKAILTVLALWGRHLHSCVGSVRISALSSDLLMGGRGRREVHEEEPRGHQGANLFMNKFPTDGSRNNCLDDSCHTMMLFMLAPGPAQPSVKVGDAMVAAFAASSMQRRSPRRVAATDSAATELRGRGSLAVLRSWASWCIENIK